MSNFYHNLTKKYNYINDVDTINVDDLLDNPSDVHCLLRSDFGLFAHSLTKSTQNYKFKILKEIDDPVKQKNCQYITDLFGQSWYNLLKYNKNDRHFYLLDLLDFIELYQQKFKPKCKFTVTEEFAKAFVSHSLEQLKELITHETNMIKLIDFVVDLIDKSLSIGYESIYDVLEEIIYDEVGDFNHEDYENYSNGVEEMYFEDEVINYIKLLRKIKNSIYDLKDSFIRACDEFDHQIRPRRSFEVQSINYSLLTFDLMRRIYGYPSATNYLSSLIHYFAKDLSEASFSRLIAKSYLDEFNFEDTEEDCLIILEYIYLIFPQYITFIKDLDNGFPDYYDDIDSNYFKIRTEYIHSVYTDYGYLNCETHKLMIVTKNQRRKIKQALKMLQYIKQGNYPEFVQKYTIKQAIDNMNLININPDNQRIIAHIFRDYN